MNLKINFQSSIIIFVVIISVVSVVFGSKPAASHNEINHQYFQKNISFPLLMAKKFNVHMKIDNSTNFKNTGTDTKFKSRKLHFGSSISGQLLRCVIHMSPLRCMKVYLLQRMDTASSFHHTENLTQDFMDQFLTLNDKSINLLDEKYKNISDSELTTLLTTNFNIFFKKRQIQFNLMPGLNIQFVASPDNELRLSLPNNENVMSDGRRRADKNFYRNKMVQMAIPVLMMPAILLGTFLPFMIPAFKMATIMSTLINKGALIAALLYAARTSAQQSDAEIIHYSHPGYH